MFNLLFLAMCFLNTENYRLSYDIWCNIDQKVLTKADRPQYDYLSMALAIYSNNPSLAHKSATNILDSFQEVPERYMALAYIVMIDVNNWKIGGLDNIERMMDNVKRDLKASYADKTVQMNEKKIVEELDKLIKEKQDEADAKVAKAAGKPGEAVYPEHQPDSVISGESGEGKVNSEKIKDDIAKIFRMPEKDRARAIMSLVSSYPVRYRVVIESYFKSLAGTK